MRPPISASLATPQQVWSPATCQRRGVVVLLFSESDRPQLFSDSVRPWRARSFRTHSAKGGRRLLLLWSPHPARTAQEGVDELWAGDQIGR